MKELLKKEIDTLVENEEKSILATIDSETNLIEAFLFEKVMFRIIKELHQKGYEYPREYTNPEEVKNEKISGIYKQVHDAIMHKINVYRFNN